MPREGNQRPECWASLKTTLQCYHLYVGLSSDPGLKPESSEPSEEKGWGLYRLVFRLPHSLAAFAMATHLCFSTLLGPKTAVIRFNSAESKIPIFIREQSGTLCEHPYEHLAALGKLDRTIAWFYSLISLFVYLFTLSLTAPLHFIWWHFPCPDMCHFQLTCTLGLLPGPQFLWTHKHRHSREVIFQDMIHEPPA